MKILHVTKKYPKALGGDAIVVANLEKQQRLKGDKVCILTTNCDEINDKKGLYKFGLKDSAARIDKITLKRIISLLMLYFKAFQVIKTEKPDVIHVHSIDMAFFISFAARRHNVPIVNTFHCLTFNDPQEPMIRRKSELYFLRKAKVRKVIVLTKLAANELKDAGFDNVTILNNGISLEDWSVTSKKQKSNLFTFVAVGRLEFLKGFTYIISAASELRKAQSNFKVLIVGEGSLRDSLQSQINDLKLNNYVVLKGARSQRQLKQIYSSADAFILSSISEAMPVALLEAWASGLPAIVTKVKSIPSMVGDAALKIRPKNSNDLQKAMATFIEDRRLTSELSKKGHKIVIKEYQWKDISEKLNQIYLEVSKPTILHLADFVPPYLDGGGGGAISTIKNIEFLSHISNYHVITRKHQDKSWKFANAQVHPVFQKIIIVPKSIKELMIYAAINSSAIVYKKNIDNYVKKLNPSMIYISSNCLPLIRAAIKTKVPTFIDVRDDYFNDPIMSRRFPREKNEILYLYRHVKERNRVPSGLKYSTGVLVLAFWAHSKIQRIMLKRLIKRQKQVYFISLSDFIKNRLIDFGVPVSRITTIYNASDIHNLPVISSEKRNNDVVFAGIIEKNKGVWTIISAAEKLKDEPMNFVLVGNGPDFSSVEKYISDKKLNKVKLAGKLSHKEVLSIYARSKIILGPSIWPEPFGRFIQESIATQTPLIATKVGGIPEGIKSNTTGILIDPDDSTELAQSILRLFKDQKLYKNISSNLSNMKSKYSSDKLGNKRYEFMTSKLGERS